MIISVNQVIIQVSNTIDALWDSEGCRGLKGLHIPWFNKILYWRAVIKVQLLYVDTIKLFNNIVLINSTSI